MYHDGNADANVPSGFSSWVDGFLNCMDKKLFCHALDKDNAFMNRVWTALIYRPLVQVNFLPDNLCDGENLKVARVPATLLRIGSWQFASEHEGDLVGKFYFATQEIVWEVLANDMKYKMEMQWSAISAIRATTEENKLGILEIELHWLPKFYVEINPRPRHHADWISVNDFTNGQALICRRHYLEFPSAAFEFAYARLLSSDRRLFELSHGGFLSKP
ncbi:hypothetical protein BT93_H3273 [Corymbia citriodora subsp. variegata]|nr:hypothetical protein BT93_H3273 [Corymbia citriodora subsp. variegata]